jgi:two-component system, OmpR family, sensor kinase
MVLLLILVILVVDSTTYALLRSFLIGRIDSQLTAPTTRVATVLFLGGQIQERGPGRVQVTTFPSGTVAELAEQNGTVVFQKPFDFTSDATSSPILPKSLPNAGLGQPTVLTVRGTGGVSWFEIAVWSEDAFAGRFVVLAVPLTEVLSTLDHLAFLEFALSVSVVVAAVILALVLIRIGLQPLQRIGEVARDIAAGDLSRRVEEATPDTEVGRLGLALNGMLSQIESAFADRKALELRLRRFSADASHELRTPLTSIRGYAEMLRRGAAKSARDSEFARRRIEEEAIRMTGIVEDMLLLARLDHAHPLQMFPVDLAALARDAVEDARVASPKQPIQHVAPEPVVVVGDNARLRQVIGNLVRNALMHARGAGTIEVAVRSEGDVGQVLVVDHGPGIEPSDRERIFEPFFRPDNGRSRDHGGAGLGLSIVAAVVKAHGGRVWVCESEGGGATFVVELPLVGDRDGGVHTIS